MSPVPAAPDARPPGQPLLLGIRHHGPGSARAVRAALAAYAPKVLLVEGPPEADSLIGCAGDPAMRPPVALLAHAVDEPGKAAFWPLAGFSPEWVAIRWALDHGVPVRFIDLPAAHSLAMTQESFAATAEAAGHGAGHAAGHGAGEPGEEAEQVRQPLRTDPLAVLAETAGYDDAERWWDDVVEHRGPGDRAGDAGETPPYAPFAALAEAMAALREPPHDAHGRAPGHEGAPGSAGADARDLVREAHMRLRLREARREFGDQDVAVVCGAWHVPALAATAKVTADRKLLRGLPKVKTEVTWVPWTHRRLARHSGYGAGITSPGWYAHLFAAPDRPVERWLTKVAGLLRDEGYAVSSAHVIEAVRLADGLAALRGRPLAGLTETTDAVRAVMCEGADVPPALVQDRLVVGDVLGEVPEGAPAVPLQRDLTRWQRSLRLKPAAEERELELDLRRDGDAARSRLLHRLRLLGVDWGVPAVSRTHGTGTFRESWRLRWEPELSVRVAEAGAWGTTVASAATARAASEAGEATALADVTALAERCLLAELPEALPVVMRALADRAALDADVGRLAQALPALVRSVRYGDVRGTGTSSLAEVARGIAERIRVGLPPACAGLDADGAARMRVHLDEVHRATALLSQGPDTREDGDGTVGAVRGEVGAGRGKGRDADEDGEGGEPLRGLRGRWQRMLRTLAGRDRVPGLLRGRCARLLLDDGQLAEGEAERLMSLALSPGTAPADAAAWVEGFLSGGGMLLVHDERLLALVDGWLASVPAEAFTDVLPLLRRTFAEYEPGLRRTLGELVRRGPGGGAAAGSATDGARAEGFGPGFDAVRADAVLPLLRLLLGTPPESTPVQDVPSEGTPPEGVPRWGAPTEPVPSDAAPSDAAPSGGTPPPPAHDGPCTAGTTTPASTQGAAA